MTSCSAPAPLWCSEGRSWRVDPVVAMVTGRYTWDDPADPGEIDPFKSGTPGFSVQLAGIEIARVLAEDRFRVGLNAGFGITEHVHNGEKAGIMIMSYSAFVQVTSAFRVDVGVMHAKSGAVERMDPTGPWDVSDKTAGFLGVSFPVVSDTIRKLVAKLP